MTRRDPAGVAGGGDRRQAGVHQIGEVAQVVGLSLRTIRHYDDVGLIRPSGRTSGGFRLYTDDDIERLQLVKHMKPLEFTLDEMRDLLEARDALAHGLADAVEADQLRDRLAGYAAVAEERCRKLRAQLRAAESMVELLRAAGSPDAPG